MKTMNAWADVGSHGGIFEFIGGPVGRQYPNLLNIYSKKLTPNLVPVRITMIKPPRKPKSRDKD
jgi:hypothetical protein